MPDSTQKNKKKNLQSHPAPSSILIFTSLIAFTPVAPNEAQDRHILWPFELVSWDRVKVQMPWLSSVQPSLPQVRKSTMWVSCLGRTVAVVEGRTRRRAGRREGSRAARCILVDGWVVERMVILKLCSSFEFLLVLFRG